MIVESLLCNDAHLCLPLDSVIINKMIRYWRTDGEWSVAERFSIKFLNPEKQYYNHLPCVALFMLTLQLMKMKF